MLYILDFVLVAGWVLAVTGTPSGLRLTKHRGIGVMVSRERRRVACNPLEISPLLGLEEWGGMELQFAILYQKSSLHRSFRLEPTAKATILWTTGLRSITHWLCSLVRSILLSPRNVWTLLHRKGQRSQAHTRGRQPSTAWG